MVLRGRETTAPIFYFTPRTAYSRDRGWNWSPQNTFSVRQSQLKICHLEKFGVVSSNLCFWSDSGTYPNFEVARVMAHPVPWSNLQGQNARVIVRKLGNTGCPVDLCENFLPKGWTTKTEKATATPYTCPNQKTFWIPLVGDTKNCTSY